LVCRRSVRVRSSKVHVGDDGTRRAFSGSFAASVGWSVIVVDETTGEEGTSALHDLGITTDGSVSAQPRPTRDGSSCRRRSAVVDE
jgi:hypothetical protein